MLREPRRRRLRRFYGGGVLGVEKLKSPESTWENLSSIPPLLTHHREASAEEPEGDPHPPRPGPQIRSRNAGARARRGRGGALDRDPHPRRD